MAVSLSPVFNNDHSVSDANGAPRSGALLFTYLAGTSTKTTTYKTSSGSGGASHTNPIILDSNGLPPAPIWLTQGASYKFVLAPSTDSDPPVSAILTIDNITGINDIDVAGIVATEWTPSALAGLTYLSATTFSVTGDQTSTLDVNRRLKFACTAGTRYGTIIKSTFTSLTTVTVLMDSGNLDSGINIGGFSYGIISAANTSLPFFSRDQQCGRLVYVSATSIRLDPQDGNTIWVYTAAAGWARRAIPSAGISAANSSVYVNGTSGQNLVANTTYYVYLFDNSGTLTMDFRSAVPVLDATSGLYVATGVQTRLLIGMVRTNGSTPGQFQTPALVLSWYKRRSIKASTTFTANQTTTSASVVELEAAKRVLFLSWAEEDILVQYVGHGYHSVTGAGFDTAITLDGVVTTVAGITTYAPVLSYRVNVSFGGLATVTDGYHDARIGVSTTGPTATWAAGTLFVLTKG
jgi:hypothetical protein